MNQSRLAVRAARRGRSYILPSGWMMISSLLCLLRAPDKPQHAWSLPQQQQLRQPRCKPVTAGRIAAFWQTVSPTSQGLICEPDYTDRQVYSIENKLPLFSKDINCKLYSLTGIKVTKFVFAHSKNNFIYPVKAGRGKSQVVGQTVRGKWMKNVNCCWSFWGALQNNC